MTQNRKRYDTAFKRQVAELRKERIHELEKKLHDVELEHEILKKALNFFS